MLIAIADSLESRREEFVERACLETGLPRARFQGELSRTTGQIKMFAEILKEGFWLDVRIDREQKERKPLAKPDVRSMRKALGPVAIFCASNFPLAFSVAGGDTISALAAGCPVVVMANPAHPGTAELAGAAISEAVSKSGFDEGWFSLLFSADHEAGKRLVENDVISAVGFTGSRKGGLAIADFARNRKVPIPVFAEMSAVNPVFVFESALEEPEVLAKGIFSSFTIGYGQFCTKPGVVVVPKGESAERLKEAIAEAVSGADPMPLLSSGIKSAYSAGIDKKSATQHSIGKTEEIGHKVPTALYVVDAKEFIEDRKLSEEHFGPSTVVVEAESVEQFEEIAETFEGQLTATIHANETELANAKTLVSILERLAGRVILNGYPTGVEVCDAMVHGGPFPATTDASTTSVGGRAIERFTRLVCYQGFPDEALPEELRDENPLGIPRRES